MVLPVCSEMSLLALLKLEIELEDSDAEKAQTVQDIKALVAGV